MENTHITGAQLQKLIDRYALNVAEFSGGQTVFLARNNGKLLKVDTVRKMLGLHEAKGWEQYRNWVKVYI